MRFASISHLMNKQDLNQIPKSWIDNDLIISPELSIMDKQGFIIGLKRNPKEMMFSQRDKIQRLILKAVLYAQDNLDVDLIQLGALTTSVTSGGKWLINQSEYRGFVTHGDSYTAAVTCQAALKSLGLIHKKSSEVTCAIIGPYGIIGEAVSKILVPSFKHSYLIGRRNEKLQGLSGNLSGNFDLTTDIKSAKNADIIITATSHPDALLTSDNLKKSAIVIDVSQPSNLTLDVCKKRPDIIRIDGGIVDFPAEYALPIPNIPSGKNLACITELIMQALEDDRHHYVGSIDLVHLRRTEEWAKKYGFIIRELTNFGKPISMVNTDFQN